MQSEGKYMLYFENDYCEGAHPAILQKLVETNFEKVSGLSLIHISEPTRH
mgnify:CR=1 FL=1